MKGLKKPVKSMKTKIVKSMKPGASVFGFKAKKY
jgi:hypothetical protein